MNKDECCPEFDPKRWDDKTYSWDKKKFIMESIPTFFHTPFPPMINKKMWKLWNLAEKSKAMISKKEDILVLFHDPHAFKSEIFMSVDKKVEGADNRTITGTFYARVFDGPYGSVPKFIKKINQILEKKGKKAKDYYIHYAYCPKCSKKFGHNYMVFFAEVWKWK